MIFWIVSRRFRMLLSFPMMLYYIISMNYSELSVKKIDIFCQKD